MIKDSIYIQGLVDYIKDVKPYSSKLIDVAVEYIFDDSLAVKITDAHAFEVTQKSYWTTTFTYDGTTLVHQIPAIMFPRTSDMVHQTYHLTVGVDEDLGIIDQEDPSVLLYNAFRVRGNSSIQISVDGTVLSEGIDYRTTYTDGSPIGVASSVFQFLSGKIPLAGTVVDVDVSYYDRIFLSLSNYNGIGVSSPNSVGSVWNNPTTFVPYTIQYNPASTNSGLFDAWGGSFSSNPADPTVLPPSFDAGYDDLGYDLYPFEDQVIDPADFTNGIANWDVRPWDGSSISDFANGSVNTDLIDDTHIITGFLTNQYGYTTPIISAVLGRTGMRIATIRKLVDSNAREYYTFEFNPTYLAAFVPLGTFVQLDIDQREAISEMIHVSLREMCFISDIETAEDYLTYMDNNLGFGYDIGYYDEAGYDNGITNPMGIVTTETGYDDINTVDWQDDGFDGDPYDNSDSTQLVASTLYEQLSIVSQRTDMSEITQVFSLSIPDAVSGNIWSVAVTGKDRIIINHYFGDTNPAGPYAHTGGVKVIITDASSTPTHVFNPYYTNVPQLFNTVEILFAAPSDATITIIKP